jgi:hypothetical protein
MLLMWRFTVARVITGREALSSFDSPESNWYPGATKTQNTLSTNVHFDFRLALVEYS